MSIQIKGLTSIYGKGTVFEKTALKDINITINAGEYIGLIGHTGSGKSTLIQHLNSLIKPTTGEILVDGVNINESKETLKQVRKKVGLVFQYPEHQLFEITIYDDVAYGAKKLGYSQNEVDKSVRNSLQLVGIAEDLFGKSPFELSGGQKRKVAIAGILAMNPKILVLDEPTAGLDPKSRDDLLENIQAMRKKMNLTIILVSHSMEDIAKYVDKIIVMNDGEVIFFDTPSEVFKNENKLVEIGLSVPQVTTLINRLNNNGFNINTGIFTIDEIVKELLLNERNVDK